MAKKTTNVRLSAAGMRLLGELRDMLHEETLNAFAIGDTVNQLKHAHGLTVKEIAKVLDASRQRLSEYRRTAAAFPPGLRDPKIQFHFYTLSVRASRRLGLKPPRVLRQLRRARIESTREATRFLAGQIAMRHNARAAAGSAKVALRNHGTLNRPHHNDFRQVLPQMAARSIQLIVADPPYAGYVSSSGIRSSAATATHRDCDNLTDDEAIKVTVDLFELSAAKIVEGGALLLFQPGGHADRPEILLAAAEHGWECRHAITWHKGHIQMGGGKDPYSIASERLLVFARVGDTLINHDESDRSDVIYMTPGRFKQPSDGQRHMYEKPAELCERLIRKHTYEGQVVFEPFGGSGSASLAAINLGRRWVYCETNKRNFNWAAKRLSGAVEEGTASVG